MVISSSAIIHDSVILIRDRLLSSVTDPISGTRPTDSKFVMTSFPERPAVYPLITIEQKGMNDRNLGMRSETSLVAVDISVNVWSKSTKQRDTLADSVYNSILTYQTGTNELIDSGLYDVRLINCFNFDEEGFKGIHRKIMEFRFNAISS